MAKFRWLLPKVSSLSIDDKLRSTCRLSRVFTDSKAWFYIYVMDIYLIRIIVFSLARKQLLGTHHFRCEGVIKSRIALVCVRQLQAFLKAKQEHVRFCQINRLRRRKYVLRHPWKPPAPPLMFFLQLVPLVFDFRLVPSSHSHGSYQTSAKLIQNNRCCSISRNFTSPDSEFSTQINE